MEMSVAGGSSATLPRLIKDVNSDHKVRRTYAPSPHP